MSIVTIFVQSDNASSERRFDKSLSIKQLKAKLETITGIPLDSQSLQLYNGDTLVASVEGDDYMLGAFPVDNFMTLKVVDTSPSNLRNQYTDVSLVEKYEMPEEEYAKRRFADDLSSTSDSTHTFEEEAKNIKVGDRCEVDFGDEGETKFKPGHWVGIQYDEPIGKHDGVVQGERYFSCPDKYGAFVRPNKVKVGDYPEEEFEEM
ncbi:3702_t:CDS:2 [Acaulospora colombiana]|uniref:3702_t:CDS:1 n=1 Tax=Acaulospora colombiana TaxID=27376 RepID=A0ACA9LDB7_9GLOM|nr:3702_t:CDS:2 [Acaulospora colombiana]